MKRLLTLSTLAFLLLSISLSHLAFGRPSRGGGIPRINVCHVMTSRTLSNGNTVVIGQILRIPLAAVPAHLGHGDKLAPGAAPGSCCAFCVTEDGRSCPVNFD
ncbi:MAG: hypothetical protein QF805_27060 [Pirellulaceae bacterium]|jgi:hypothetical protein|nr:hypothetical protein [Pirellulaceae bacterium]